MVHWGELEIKTQLGQNPLIATATEKSSQHERQEQKEQVSLFASLVTPKIERQFKAGRKRLDDLVDSIHDITPTLLFCPAAKAVINLWKTNTEPSKDKEYENLKIFETIQRYKAEAVAKDGNMVCKMCKARMENYPKRSNSM